MSVIQAVPTSHVHQSWPLVEPFLSAALEWSNGDITLDQLRADLGQGRCALYWARDDAVVGAAAVAFQNNRNKRVAFVLAMGGRLIADQENFAQFAALLKQAGATHIGGAGRPSTVRLWSRFGFKEKSVLFERSI